MLRTFIGTGLIFTGGAIVGYVLATEWHKRAFWKRQALAMKAWGCDGSHLGGRG